MPNRQQAIIWANDGLSWWCIYTSLDLESLQLIWRSCTHIFHLHMPDHLRSGDLTTWHNTRIVVEMPHWYIKGILPKGPYLPCISMAGRALLAGYHRYSEHWFRYIALNRWWAITQTNSNVFSWIKLDKSWHDLYHVSMCGLLWMSHHLGPVRPYGMRDHGHHWFR